MTILTLQLCLQVPLTLISEIFNIRYRTISMTICLMWQWLCTFSIVRIMPIALDTITTKTYFLFGGIFIVSSDFNGCASPADSPLSLHSSLPRSFGRSVRKPNNYRESFSRWRSTFASTFADKPLHNFPVSNISTVYSTLMRNPLRTTLKPLFPRRNTSRSSTTLNDWRLSKSRDFMASPYTL